MISILVFPVLHVRITIRGERASGRAAASLRPGLGYFLGVVATLHERAGGARDTP